MLLLLASLLNVVGLNGFSAAAVILDVNGAYAVIASLHAVACFTTFAYVPTLLAVLMLLSLIPALACGR